MNLRKYMAPQSREGREIMKKALVLGFISLFLLACGDTSDEPTPPMLPDGSTADVLLPDASPLEPDLPPLPSNVDPVQACYDIAMVLGDKMLACSEDAVAAASFQKSLEDAWDCPSITAVRDVVELYTVCFPAIKAMSCTDFQDANVPSSCKTQLS